MSTCPGCGCTAEADAHAVVAALRNDDVDAAIDAGLLVADPCPACTDACCAALTVARDARLRALAARERHRKRALRLRRLADERLAARALPSVAQVPAATTPRLPPAAAAALARAKAKAARPPP